MRGAAAWGRLELTGGLYGLNVYLARQMRDLIGNFSLKMDMAGAGSVVTGGRECRNMKMGSVTR